MVDPARILDTSFRSFALSEIKASLSAANIVRDVLPTWALGARVGFKSYPARKDGCSVAAPFFQFDTIK